MVVSHLAPLDSGTPVFCSSGALLVISCPALAGRPAFFRSFGAGAFRIDGRLRGIGFRWPSATEAAAWMADSMARLEVVTFPFVASRRLLVVSAARRSLRERRR